MKKKPSVIIPSAELGKRLVEASQIKSEMAELLRNLEEQTTGLPSTKLGGWRHNTTGWSKRS